MLSREKRKLPSVWLTHFGHDLILYYHFSIFALVTLKTKDLTLFLYIISNYYFKNAKNTTSYKRKYTSVITLSHTVRM